MPAVIAEGGPEVGNLCTSKRQVGQGGELESMPDEPDATAPFDRSTPRDGDPDATRIGPASGRPVDPDATRIGPGGSQPIDPDATRIGPADARPTDPDATRIGGGTSPLRPDDSGATRIVRPRR